MSFVYFECVVYMCLNVCMSLLVCLCMPLCLCMEDIMCPALWLSPYSLETGSLTESGTRLAAIISQQSSHLCPK